MSRELVKHFAASEVVKMITDGDHTTFHLMFASVLTDGARPLRCPNAVGMDECNQFDGLDIVITSEGKCRRLSLPKTMGTET